MNIADLSSREFSEPWPSSRTNHYWADCNRDWLSLQYPEGQNSMEMYRYWMPDVVVDQHEQGGDGKGFYFSPGHPLRTNPNTPPENQRLTSEITSNIAANLDQIGSLYYSKEGYDDYFYGKGASYGDMNGSVAILVEQIASRGYMRPTSMGEMSFPVTIRNQTFAGFSSVFAAYNMKEKLLQYQRTFFINSAKEAKNDKIKGYIFNTSGRKAIEYHFLCNIKRHQIDVYKLKKDVTKNGTLYSNKDSYIIPVEQKNYKTIRTLWENVTQFEDSTFYDVSTWTFPHAYNLSYCQTENTDGLVGQKVDEISMAQGIMIGGESNYAYVFDNREFYTPKMVTELLARGLFVRVAKKSFILGGTSGKTRFGAGTLVVPVQNQPIDAKEIYKLISSLGQECGVDVFSLQHGLMEDFDLGSPMFKVLRMPKVAMVVGNGMGIPESGEIWHMMDQRFQIPLTLIEYSSLSNVDLKKYNVLIFADGELSSSVVNGFAEKLNDWVKDSGVVIASGKSFSITNAAKLTNIKPLLRNHVENTDKEPKFSSYASREGANAGDNVDGAILKCHIDTTHPLGWGYDNDEVAVIKTSATVLEVPKDKYSVPMYYTGDPYLSGCISKKNLGRVAQSPEIITESYGKGISIVILDDLNFRSYWYGTNKIFMNAILFGYLI